MSYLYVKWNSLYAGRSPTIQSLEHALSFPGHSRNGSLRRRCLDPYSADAARTVALPIPTLAEYSKPPFSASHFLGHCFGLIPAPGSFAASAFPVPPEHVT